MISDRTGEQFGQYRLEKRIGTGGFATVYLGIHMSLGTQAAIKLLHAYLTDNEIQEFQKEARMIANLQHPHIVQVRDFATQDGTPYLVLEYAPYGSLRSLYAQEGSFSLSQVALYVQQVAGALFYAHERKIIHRDIKPDNMLLNIRREVLLGDFGIAVVMQSTHSAAQSFQGTFAYTAPEQIQGQPRPASDQYALAVAAYEWICGQRPFSGTAIELMGQHIHAQPPRPSSIRPGLSPQIEAVILRALAKDPQQRFPAVTDFAHALAEACQGKQLAPDLKTHTPGSFPISAPGGEATILPPSIPPTVQAAPFTQAPQTIRATSTPAPSASPGPSTTDKAARQRTTRTDRPQIRHPALPSFSKVKLPELPQMPEIVLPERRSTPRQYSSGRRKALIGVLGGLGVLGLGGGALWFKVISPFLDAIPFTYTGHQASVNALAWSPDGKRIVSGDDTASVQCWDAFDGKNVQQIHWSDLSKITIPSEEGPMRTQALSWGNANQSIAIGFSTRPTVLSLDGVPQDPSIDAVFLLNAATWKPLGGLRKGGFTVAWSPDGTRLASASYYWHTVDVWDALTGKEICHYNKHAQDTGMDQVAWSPDGSRIASAGGDATVQIWNAENAEHIITLNTLDPSEPGSRARAVSWSPDGSHIATAGDDEKVSVWETSTGKRLFTYPNPGASFSSVAWSPNGKWIASGSDDNTAYILDAHTGKLLLHLAPSWLRFGHTERVNAVAWSPDSVHLATASDDDTVIVWKPSW